MVSIGGATGGGLLVCLIRVPGSDPGGAVCFAAAVMDAYEMDPLSLQLVLPLTGLIGEGLGFLGVLFVP